MKAKVYTRNYCLGIWDQQPHDALHPKLPTKSNKSSTTIDFTNVNTVRNNVLPSTILHWMWRNK